MLVVNRNYSASSNKRFRGSNTVLQIHAYIKKRIQERLCNFRQACDIKSSLQVYAFAYKFREYAIFICKSI